MIRKIKEELAPLTRELANDFANAERWHGDRQVTDARANFLRSRWDEGLFYAPTWVRAWLRGKLLRINGQASSKMFAAMNGEFPSDFKVVLIEYTCDTEQDVADLFDQFDRPESIRRLRQSEHAHAATETLLTSVCPSAVSRALSGLSFYLTDAGLKHSLDRHDRVGLIHSHQDFILWASEFSTSKLLTKRSTCAALYATWKTGDVGVATDFWRLVREDSHPDVGNPTRWLNKFLVERRVSAHSQTNRKFVWDDRAIYVKCIHAWNAWRKGGTTDGKYYAEAPLPEVV